MDEIWWLSCTDPAAMLRLVTENPDHANINCTSERKLRLWAEAAGPCATCRGIGNDPAWDAQRWATYVVDSPCLPKAEKAALLRDIIGNPFRPVPTHTRGIGRAYNPEWLGDPQVVAIAEGIYNARDFAALGVLADALEEAGADNADLLTHLRSPDPHVKGCWALDLILGKD